MTTSNEVLPVVGKNIGYQYDNGSPLNWRGEIGGKLAPAVKAVARSYANADRPVPHPDQIHIVGEYFHYFISAPCWHDSGHGELLRLRNMAAQIKTMDQIRAFLSECFDLGIDPL